MFLLGACLVVQEVACSDILLFLQVLKYDHQNVLKVLKLYLMFVD